MKEILSKIVHSQIIALSLIYSLSIVLFLLPSQLAEARDDNKYEWMNSSLEGLNTQFADDVQVPQLNDSMDRGRTSLNLANPGIWIATGQYVKKDRAIKFDWSTLGATATNSRKYKVLYRIDPRFKSPQIFIKTFNSKTKKYEATYYPAFNSKDLNKDYASLAFDKMQDYVGYFTFAKGREKIRIEKGDIINITLIEAADFFAVNAASDGLDQELDSKLLILPMVYTSSNLNSFDNRVIYSSAEKICDVIDPARNAKCKGKGVITTFRTDDAAMVGKPVDLNFLTDLYNRGIQSCPEGANERDNSLCYYDQGRGMRISVNNQIIKREADSFIYSKKLKKSFVYYKSSVGGDLDFVTNWSISDGMFDNNTTSILMQDWLSFKANFTDVNAFQNSILKNIEFNAHYLHFGRYIMKVEVGSSEGGELSVKQQQDIKVEYFITDQDALSPGLTQVGTEIDKDSTFDANKSGHLWLKVSNPNQEVSGTINVNYTTYSGSTWFSDIIYNKAVEPIIQKFHKFTKDFYRKLTRNSSLQRIGRIALVLYICIYAAAFLAGAVQITAKDLVIRAIKITLIGILLGENSWEFFNTYLFSAFMDGTYHLIKNVIGLTSSTANIFGFIDPIFAKYTSGSFWFLLFIELLQIHNGFTFIAIITIYSLTLYFRAILEVIVGYVIAYVGLAVMISLAPFFIILFLFEKTKSIFDNWLSTLFSYVMQPSILLIFFLLIDQVMAEQLTNIVVKARWDPAFIPLRLGLDLNYLGIPFSIPPFEIPFLPGIPFFAPVVTPITDVESLLYQRGTFLIVFSSALLFYAFCLMVHGLVAYIAIVVAQLTNVTPSRKEGMFQRPEYPTTTIVSDIMGIGTPFKNAALAPLKLFKDKVIDQNYEARRPRGKPKEYTSKIFASRNDVNNSDEGERNQS